MCIERRRASKAISCPPPRTPSGLSYLNILNFFFLSHPNKETTEAKLEKELEAAIEADDFEKCELLQALIDARKEAVAALEDAKSARRFADAKAAKAALDKLPTTLAEYLAVAPP